MTERGLSQIHDIFSQEVELSVKNVISANPGLDEAELREKIEHIIEKYFDQSIGFEKMRVLLSARGLTLDPAIVLEVFKAYYTGVYATRPLPRINSQETLRKIANIEVELESKIDKALEGVGKGLGYCHYYWSAKKKILLEDYGIVWYSPAECNPGILYD
ncbi:MAG: hypothetical protein K2H74_00745 [Paramuribaculum sp.]|nr:hypothetical protein [Paramuribaculum sp.]